MTNEDPEAQAARALHSRLGRLLANSPNLVGAGRTEQATLQWLGRVEAAIEQAGRHIDLIDFRGGRRLLGSMAADESKIFGPIYTVMAKLEQQFDMEADAVFLPAGAPFDSYRAVVGVLGRATQGVLVVDRYLDSTILTRYMLELSPAVEIRLLATSPPTRHLESLLQASQRWNQQHPAQLVEIRLAPQHEVHDRLLVIDGREAWSSTQSFKDLADTAPAELVNAMNTAAEKIEAYQEIWDRAEIVALN